ncbi:terminase large subunit [Paenibacillus caseinilyticus]|uniref:terminase large subunit n=1 Tax=Paenibacillus caseinilyticus TaxID=3098138 RepID=UPI0022B8ED8E|nr:terminase TerL endonuclease subunit [Paenibacillus caseinilyticus]MCZ8518875.1 terminase large subunit [Paenibacillus caseinilyticus]
MSSKITSAAASNRTTAYALQVIGGEIVTGQLLRKACERHLADLEDADSEYYFDPEAADHAIDFFRFLKHSKGEWGGHSFELEPWQHFIVGSIFGWKQKSDGMRRFRTAYIEVARKNGKSALISGIGLYLLIADGEPGAEVYTAATNMKQARIIHQESVRMVKASPALKKRIKSFKDNLFIENSASKYEPVAADADTLDGLNVHAALVDELHAHKKRALWDVLDTATGARRQPLMLAITTAGFDQSSFCFEQREYGEKVLNKTVQDDMLFAFIAAPDPGDDPFSVETWKKANPNYGISVKENDLKRLARRAKEMPSSLNNFLTKRLNIWTQQADRWIDLELWDRNADDGRKEKELLGRTCYGGLDLSSVSDITAWVMSFPREDDPETVDILARFWVPEARLTDRRNRYADQYRAWKNKGLLQTTPGDAIDYAFVKAQVLKDAEIFGLEALNVDRLFQGYQMALELAEEGLTVVPMGQGFMSMAAPMMEFERRLRRNKIRHGGNAVLRWMADSMAVKKDPAGNVKPDKASSQGKIDGIVALVMSLDLVMRNEDNRSTYEKRGVRQL